MKYLLMFLILCTFTSCKTISVLYVVNPAYEKLLQEDKIPPKNMAKWLPKKKLMLKGVGKNEVDMTEGKETMKQDSGLKIPDFPKIEFDN